MIFYNNYIPSGLKAIFQNKRHQLTRACATAKAKVIRDLVVDKNAKHILALT